MTNQENLEKSSQDYKKSQYGSWYKKAAENKDKVNMDKKKSFFEKLIEIFSKK